MKLKKEVVRNPQERGLCSEWKRCLAACLVVCAGSFAGAADIYVSTNGVHAVEGNELGWGTYVTDDGESHNAYTNLQQAVDAAARGDTVWVEDGFVCDDSNGYYTTGEWPVYYAEIRFRLRISKDITLRSRSGKWENGPVILGKWESTETPDQIGTTYGSNSVAGLWATGGTKILGFRIQDCSRPVTGGSAVYGSPSLENCHVARCRALGSSVDASVVRNSVIEDCWPLKITYNAGVKIYDTLFVSNNVGDACACELKQGAVVSNCVFTGTSGNSAVVSICSPTNATTKPLVLDCVFSNNSVRCIAQAYGGGYSVLVSNCVFVGNARSVCYTEVNSQRFGHHFDFYNCTITDNVIGADFSSSAPLFGSSGSSLYNCLIARNAQKWTGKPLVMGLDETAPVSFYNCTLVGNTSEHYLVSGVVHAVNAVFSDNTSKMGMPLAGATNCCLNVGSEETPGTGNVFADDPLFVDAAAGDYRLKRKSPCRETGLWLDWMAGATDLEGNPRVLGRDGRASADARPDIGCYECAEKMPGFMIIVQ